MLRNATVDAFRPHPQHTILEATLLPFERATPEPLLKRGIYNPIAVALKGGALREASMVMLAQALGAVEGALASSAEPMAKATGKPRRLRWLPSRFAGRRGEPKLLELTPPTLSGSELSTISSGKELQDPESYGGSGESSCHAA